MFEDLTMGQTKAPRAETLKTVLGLGAAQFNIQTLQVEGQHQKTVVVSCRLGILAKLAYSFPLKVGKLLIR